MRRAAGRFLILAIAVALFSSGASGYYYYVHFASRFSPYNPIAEKFDVGALRNKTVYYFISDAGPSQLAPGDSFTAFISEIRAAAKVWNDVGTSDLRLAFGGLNPSGLQQNTPGIDVVFDDDIPPGLAALGGPTTCVSGAGTSTCTATGLGSGSTAAFVPIQRSSLRVRRDLSNSPSFGEDMFTTLVHEFGHTLGLQHTLTSATMSTAITRATTKAAPLAADDIAGISGLYPTGSFLANTGSISGHVTLGGAGVNMASVVAIAANGPAVSALTNPDGGYTIQGLPPGQSYYLYVHPLPPPTVSETKPANIEPPKDPDGNPLPSGSAFDTVFYPGVKDPNQASPFFIGDGDARTGVDFNVNRRASPAISSVTTYGYYGTTAVHPAPLPGSGTGVSVVATGNGLLNGSSLVPGLAVTVLGQSGANIIGGTIKYYTGAYMLFGLAPTFGSNSGPRHLIFSANNDIYVLPAGFMIVSNPAPSITALTPGSDGNGGRTVLVSGSNFDGNTRILFDGSAAVVLKQNPDGSLLVTPPPGTFGYRASVVALNSDGQSSLFVQPAPPNYIYDSSDVPQITINPSSLPAGSEAMVEIIGVNTTFIDGQTAIGFGTSDVAVRRTWITGPNRILANIAINPNANPGGVELTVSSGLQLAVQQYGFQILALNSRQVVITPPVTNALSGAAGVPAGGTAVMAVSNLNVSSASVSLTVSDQRASVISIANGLLSFQVPSGLPLGPAVVKLQIPSGDPVNPVVMNIDPPPPVITAAYSSPGTIADAQHPATRGSLTGFIVSGLPDPSTIADPSVVHINVGGVDHNATNLSSQNGSVLVQIMLSNAVPTGVQVPAVLSYNGALSAAFPIPIH